MALPFGVKVLAQAGCLYMSTACKESSRKEKPKRRQRARLASASSAINAEAFRSGNDTPKEVQEYGACRLLSVLCHVRLRCQSKASGLHL